MPERNAQTAIAVQATSVSPSRAEKCRPALKLWAAVNAFFTPLCGRLGLRIAEMIER